VDSVADFRCHGGGVMKEQHLLDNGERRLFFEVAATELKMLFEITDKDYT